MLFRSRREVVSLADPARRDRFVSIGGGTFSENPVTMTAGLATLRHLRKNAAQVYEALDQRGERIRAGGDAALSEGGLKASTTGLGSLFLTHFGGRPRNAEDSAMDDRELALGYAMHLMSSGNFVLPGHPGGVSTAHTGKDVEELIEQSRRFGALAGKKGRK